MGQRHKLSPEVLGPPSPTGPDFPRGAWMLPILAVMLFVVHVLPGRPGSLFNQVRCRDTATCGQCSLVTEAKSWKEPYRRCNPTPTEPRLPACARALHLSADDAIDCLCHWDATGGLLPTSTVNQPATATEPVCTEPWLDPHLGTPGPCLSTWPNGARVV